MSLALGTGVQDTLVARATARDGDAFAMLYAQHVDRVFRHLYYRVGRREEAEDLTQQVFLKAWQSISSFRKGASSFLPWLITIAHRLIADHYRGRKGAEPIEEREERELYAEEDLEASVERSLHREALRTAIARLRSEHQLVILLRFVEQFDYAEVAAVMGKKEGAVRVLQHRALVELRSILEKEMGYRP